MDQSPIHLFNYIVITLQVVYTKKNWEKKWYLNVLAIDIWNWCISRNIHFRISHVAGCLNVEADELSRGLNLNEDLEWALSWVRCGTWLYRFLIFATLLTLDIDIFQEIVCRFGKPDIDLFASKLNHKLEKYISFRPDPNAMAVDD